MMFLDCLRARLIVSSRTLRPLPFGHFISHSRFLYFISGVFVFLVRLGLIKVTLWPVLMRALAAACSCGVGGISRVDVSILPSFIAVFLVFTMRTLVILAAI
jgi:hypothetical protein